MGNDWPCTVELCTVPTSPYPCNAKGRCGTIMDSVLATTFPQVTLSRNSCTKPLSRSGLIYPFAIQLGMAKIGYARCSTTEQNTDDQQRRLEEAGCVKVFTEPGVSGKLAHRPQWDAAMAYLRDGDILVITKLDRAGRSLQHLVRLSNELRERSIGLQVLDQGIDTTNAAGRLFYNMVASFAEFERDLIVERTHEGLRTAKLAGHKSGRKPKLDATQLGMVQQMHSSGRSVVEIAKAFKVSRPVIYRALEASQAAV